jgi:hypothetical protein
MRPVGKGAGRAFVLGVDSVKEVGRWLRPYRFVMRSPRFQQDEFLLAAPLGNERVNEDQRASGSVDLTSGQQDCKYAMGGQGTSQANLIQPVR